METELEELCVEAGQLADDQGRIAFLRRHPMLLNSKTVEELAEAVRTGVRIDLPKACALADLAVVIATELQDEETLGRALRAKANTLWFLGECRSAVNLFDRAAELLERSGNMSEVGRTLSSSIQSRALLGEYESAYQAADKARDIFRALDESWRVARLEINVANILHRQNRYRDALHSYERAYHELLPHKDMEGIGVALHNIAVCLIALDDYSAAQAVYTRVRQVCEQADMPQLVAQADYNVAYLYFLRGEYSRSLDLLRATKLACQKNGDNYHLGLCDLDSSEIYLQLNLIQEAVQSAEASLLQFRRLEMNYETVRSQLNLAVAVSLQGDPLKALALFEGAQELARKEENKILPAFIDLYSAMTLFEQGTLGDAEEFCLRALSVFESAALPRQRVICRLLLGRIFLRREEPDRAADQCEHALRLLQELDAPVLSYQAGLLRGQVYEACGQPDLAYGSYLGARSFLETLRSSLQRSELKIGFMRNRLEVYDRLIRLCLNRSDEDASYVAEAFTYVEAAKSRTLQDLILAGPQPASAQTEPDDSSQKAQDLRKTLNWYYHLIERELYSADPISEGRLKHLRLQAQSCERELYRLLLDSPSCGTMGEALYSSRAANLSEIQGALGEDATLLEYFSLEGRIYAAVISAEAFRIVPLAQVSEIANSLRMLEFQLSKLRLGVDYVKQFEQVLLNSTRRHLRDLYSRLIGPVAELLKSSSLVIVPYGPLHSLPFHALFDGENYVVDRFTVSYSPSASVFCRSRYRGLGNPEDISLILGIEDSRMPAIKEEIDAVAAMLPNARVFWAGDATESALREYGPSSRVIHIATHGYFRSDNPMFSAIRLADSYLTLHDLYGMNLPAEFMTLSGCVTGLGVIEAGDELIGLARGLLYAGARCLLLTLWEVDDQSTAHFMRILYGHSENGFSRAAAVRSAMLQLRERYPHPYYWAPFKLIGRSFDGPQSVN